MQSQNCIMDVTKTCAQTSNSFSTFQKHYIKIYMYTQFLCFLNSACYWSEVLQCYFLIFQYYPKFGPEHGRYTHLILLSDLVFISLSSYANQPCVLRITMKLNCFPRQNSQAPVRVRASKMYMLGCACQHWDGCFGSRLQYNFAVWQICVFTST